MHRWNRQVGLTDLRSRRRGELCRGSEALDGTRTDPRRALEPLLALLVQATKAGFALRTVNKRLV